MPQVKKLPKKIISHLTMSQNKCQNDIVKPFGPRALSLLKLERVLKTFSSEKGFSNLLELSLPYTSKHKPPYAQSPIFCLIKKRMKSSTHSILKLALFKQTITINSHYGQQVSSTTRIGHFVEEHDIVIFLS